MELDLFIAASYSQEPPRPHKQLKKKEKKDQQKSENTIQCETGDLRIQINDYDYSKNGAFVNKSKH